MQEMKKRLDELQEVINQYSRDFVSSKEAESVTDTFYNLKKEITRNETGDFEFQQNEGGDPYPVKVAANGSALSMLLTRLTTEEKAITFGSK